MKDCVSELKSCIVYCCSVDRSAMVQHIKQRRRSVEIAQVGQITNPPSEIMYEQNFIFNI